MSLDNLINDLNCDTKYFILMIVSIIHFFNDIFVTLYPYFFLPVYDLYFTLFALLTIISWLVLKNECIISYIEKKLIDVNYELGDDPYNHPYHNIFYNYNGTSYTFIKECFWVIAFLVIIFYRKNSKFAKYLAIIVLVIVFIIKAPDLFK